MPREHPNIVCIVADDLGWRDLGCYGSSFYETPALDALAREGTRFTDAYAAAPVCSPTRASLMTGAYPARVGVTDWIDFKGATHPARGALVDAPYEDHLSQEWATLPKALSAAGYATWHVGKWHLGGEAQDSLPEDHGFEENVGGCEWGSPQNGYFGPWEVPTLEESADEEGEYLPDRLGEEAVSLIEDHADERPFFLNYDPYLVHTPLQAPEETVERYRHKRETLGLDDVQETEFGERFPVEQKNGRRIERRLVQSHPTYAAMVETLDRNVGRVLDALDRTGRAENTVVVFSSDNGGLATVADPPTTNRPLAEGKGWMAEGGNRVPLLVRWPGVTDAPDAPDIADTPVVTPDLHATLREVAGATDRSNGEGDDEKGNDEAIDGESLHPILDDATADLNREAVFWHYPHYGNQGGTPASAVRTDRWKLIEFFEDGHVELYDLDADPRERHDLSEHRSDVREDLRDRLSAWRERVDATRPAENPEYEGWPDRAGFR